MKQALFLVLQIAQNNAATPVDTRYLSITVKDSSQLGRSSNLSGTALKLKSHLIIPHRYLTTAQLKKRKMKIHYGAVFSNLRLTIMH